MILCCGEAIVDMLPRVTAQGESAFAPHAGGAVFNTAVALGRLGAPAAFFGGLSSDMLGDVLRERLADSGVDFSLCPPSERASTVAFVKLVEGQATYAFYDEGSAGRMLGLHDLPRLGEECTALHFGGISLIPEPCGSTFEALLMRECDQRVISLDPNIRPGFIRDPQAYAARIRRMAKVADIVKFSDEDLGWFASRGEPGADPAWWLENGAPLVIVTRGAEGAQAFTRGFTVSVAARPVAVVDTVGAGDTFDAAVLASLHRQNRLSKAAIASLSPEAVEEALDLGVRAAAITVSRAGANPPFAHEIA